MRRYKQLVDMVRFARPETIIEVGTHSGRRAILMCEEALRHREAVHYVGYDLWDQMDPETNKLELNGKKPADEARARQRLDAIAKQHPGFSYQLIKGNTRDTLHGGMHCADFVFIDGGHSIETIRGDFDALKTSRVIALDDYYSGGRTDITRYGCNLVIEGTPHVVLPQLDTGPGGSVQIAAIGYDPKWTDALELCRRTYGLKSVCFWRDGEAVFSDIVACINVLEREPDLTRAMNSVVEATGGRMFFVIKEDGLRSIAWWKENLAKHVLIDEWYGHSGEVCGSARPLRIIVGAKGLQAWTEDKRIANIRSNIAAVKKRFTYENVQPHDGRIILVCYGPSLQDTWQDILPERERRGGLIVTVSGAHDFLLERGIKPDVHLECDPRPHKAKNLEKGIEGVKYYIASCAHPDLIERLAGCDITLWHMASYPESNEAIKELEPDAMFVPGGGNAGLRAWPLYYLFGYRNFSIYGMDCSFSKDGGEQHAGKHFGNRQEIIDVMTPDGEWFKSSAVLLAYKNHFCEALTQHMSDCVIEMHGTGLLQHLCSIWDKEEQEAKEKEAAA